MRFRIFLGFRGEAPNPIYARLHGGWIPAPAAVIGDAGTDGRDPIYGDRKTQKP
jgi:hypothetical protein